ncbi:hypothetical protein [Pseudomonas sp. ML2-2023-6]|uniref:hypothetical protein n=1 Tax=Pseudomonas sp. ML2-2023-6 TaxID=3122376 RepID=UPI0030D35F13
MPYPSLQLVDQKAGSYSSDMQITNRSEDDLKVQYEFLKEAYNNACSVKSSMLAKVSSHASAYFVLAGFYAYVFNELWKLDGWQKDFSVVFISIGALFLLTAGVFTFSFLQVSGGVRARFHDIRALNGSTTLSQAKHAYINWFASKSENLVLASKIKNIELNVVVAFLLIVVLWLFVFFSGADSGLKGGLQYESDLELQILNGDGVLDKEELSRLFDIVNSSDTRSADQYIVLSSNSADAEIYSGVVGMIKLVVGSSKVSELRLSSSSGFKDRIVIKIKKEG